MVAEKVNFPFAWPHQSAQLRAASNWLAVDLSALRYVDTESPLAQHPTVKSDWIEPRHCYGNTETFTLTTAFPAGTSRLQANNTLMLGYLGKPMDETLDDEGYFRTGDGGYLDGDGRLLSECRLNDIIRPAGPMSRRSRSMRLSRHARA